MGDLVGDSDALLGDSRDSKAMALGTVNTLYSLQVDALDHILNEFPEYRERMIQLAKAKRNKHKKLIVKCEKKFPVYGLLPVDAEPSVGRTRIAAFDKLKKFGLDVDINQGSTGKSK